MLTRSIRFCLLTVTTILLCACNDYEAAQEAPRNDSPEQALQLSNSVEALMSAGVPVEALSNAKPVNQAPEGQGFSLQASSNTIAGDQTPVNFADSGLAITLVGEITHEAQSTTTHTVWTQRGGPQAVLLNAGNAEAIALLPHVNVPARISFGFVAANSEAYVTEQQTFVEVLPSEAPYTVNTRIQYQQASQLTLSVSLKEPSDETVTLKYSTQDGSALANQDYVPVSGELTFAPKQRSLLVTVPLLSGIQMNSSVPTLDKYFRLVVTGTLGQFNGTVHGYGVIMGASDSRNPIPSITESAITQDALLGSAGEQRVHLSRSSNNLSLSVSSVCLLANGALDSNSLCTSSSAEDAITPLLESDAKWQNASWAEAPAVTQRYVLSNSADTPLDYTAYIFDGDKRYQITGQLAPHSRALLYTAYAGAFTSDSSSSSGSESSDDGASSNSSSSSSAASAIAHTLIVDVAPKGLDATELTLSAVLNDDIAITALEAQLNGAAFATQNPIHIPYANLQSGINLLKVFAMDFSGKQLEQDINIYLGDNDENTFIGNASINIFIGQNGVDSFTGGDGTNIYLPGAGITQFTSGSGKDIFIHQVGVQPMRLNAEGATEDVVILPTATKASAQIRQTGQQSFYLVADAQSLQFEQYFALDGSTLSSIRRIIFADGELTSTDVRRLIHAASPGNGTYWGFSGDDTIIDTDGEDAAFGGAGDDTIHVNGYATGDDGDDLIYANHGEGGAGDDEIHAVSNATGGDGNDTLYTEDYANGEEGNDTLHGNDNENQLFGGAGDDTLYGYGGDDGLYGEEGHNTLYGGDGDDSLFAARGEFDDHLFGGNGNDKLWGYDGDNYFDGGEGDETFFAGNGNNTIICGEGNHSIFGTEEGNDTITCGSGVDSIFMEDGDDDVDSGAGNDELFGGTGNKNIVAGAGDDELHFNSGDVCKIDGGLGNDTLYAHCQSLTINGGEGIDSMIVSGAQQLSVSGGLGDDFINFDGRPYADVQLLDPPYTHIFWSPGEGNDTYSIGGYSTNVEDGSSEVLTKSRSEVYTDIINSAFFAVNTALDNNIPTSHFYLGGSATLDGIRFTQGDSTSLVMHYDDATTGLTETLTFNRWFAHDTGQSYDEKFYDFLLPDQTSIKTSAINDYFNRVFYRNFDGDKPNGISVIGMPVTSDKVVITETSILVDANNYLIKEELSLTAAEWTIEFWVAIPSISQAVTPIVQWGDAPFGNDGFGIALNDTGEGFHWTLNVGEAKLAFNNNFDDTGGPQHVAVVFTNSQITLYINGQPSNTSITVDYDSMPRRLSLGYFNNTNEDNSGESTRWYLDELLISRDTAKYDGPFTSNPVPFPVEYLPSRDATGDLL